MEFIDLARDCAPQIEVTVLAAIVSLESEFRPLTIQINNDYPLAEQPTSKQEAIETASALVAEGLDLNLGLTGINLQNLTGLGMSLSDAFDPCTNLRASARLLTGYRAAAVQDNAPEPEAEMLRRFHQTGAGEVEDPVGYEKRIRAEAERLSSIIASVVLTMPDGFTSTAETGESSPMASVSPERPPSSSPSAAPDAYWDVFHSDRSNSVLVFSNP